MTVIGAMWTMVCGHDDGRCDENCGVCLVLSMVCVMRTMVCGVVRTSSARFGNVRRLPYQ